MQQTGFWSSLRTPRSSVRSLFEERLTGSVSSGTVKLSGQSQALRGTPCSASLEMWRRRNCGGADDFSPLLSSQPLNGSETGDRQEEPPRSRALSHNAVGCVGWKAGRKATRPPGYKALWRTCASKGWATSLHISYSQHPIASSQRTDQASCWVGTPMVPRDRLSRPQSTLWTLTRETSPRAIHQHGRHENTGHWCFWSRKTRQLHGKGASARRLSIGRAGSPTHRSARRVVRQRHHGWSQFENAAVLATRHVSGNGNPRQLSERRSSDHQMVPRSWPIEGRKRSPFNDLPMVAILTWWWASP